MLRRLGDAEERMLVTQGNLAMSYTVLRRSEQASNMLRDVYSGRVRLNGKEREQTVIAANNYAASLYFLKRFDEVKSLLRGMLPVARRVLGDGNAATLRMRWIYARALYDDTDGTLNDQREAVTTLEDVAPTARRVFGRAHPLTSTIEDYLRNARAVLDQSSP